MNSEGTRTGRFSCREPQLSNGPKADATEALQRAVERLQAAGAAILGVHQPGSLRAALEARSAADAAALRERLVGHDYRHAEERVLGHMLDPEFAPVDPEAFKGLPAAMYGPAGPLPCPWDNWKPGRDVA